MEYKNIFITGVSRGLGLGVCESAIEKETNIYGLSRTDSPLQSNKMHFQHCDLSRLDTIFPALEKLFKNSPQLDLVVLNAGVLGDFGDLSSTAVERAKEVMDVNLWANKVILDHLVQHQIHPKQIVLISSGASVSGNRGWNAYALSKAALNMLCRQYAHEFPETHLCAIAPGLIDTSMQNVLCNDQLDIERYPGLQALWDARGTIKMPNAKQAGAALLTIIPELRQYPNGSFQDVRQQIIDAI